ncbi:MAG: hypothetical protein AAGF11_21185 [Myxococcota bacterium]
MNVLLFALGSFTLLLAVVHVVGGGRGVLRPMLGARFDPTARATMHVVWHAITAHLVLAGAVMVGVSLGAWPEGGALLVGAVSVLHLVFAGLFLTVAATSSLPRAWLALGQWMAFLPLGLLGLWAVA